MLELAESSIMCATEQEFVSRLNGLINQPWQITEICSNGRRYEVCLINPTTKDQKSIFYYKYEFYTGGS